MLDARCKHDISDEECNKCMKHRIILQCPENCPDYEDWREDGDKNMSKDLEHIIKRSQEEMENLIRTAYHQGRREGYEAGINEVEAYHLGYYQGYGDGQNDRPRKS